MELEQARVNYISQEQIDFAIEFGLKPELEPGGMYTDPREFLSAFSAVMYDLFHMNGSTNPLRKQYIRRRYQLFHEEALRRLTSLSK